MKKLLFLLLIIFPFIIKAQSITKSDFEKSEWFSDKDISTFLKSDTISLIKVLKYEDEEFETEKLFKKHLKDTYEYITILSFLENKELTIIQLNNKNNNEIYKTGEWEFNLENRVLNLYIDKKLQSSFGFKSNMNGNIVVSRDINNNNTIALNFKEITFIRIK
tara:strand:- start:27 stop:515 length:489 start_codon:yes stop_codon:yes gene_type:complete